MTDRFERLAPGYREAIQYVMALVPGPTRERLRVRFVTGVAGSYVGLHPVGLKIADSAGYESYGAWAYDEVAHAGDARHQWRLPADQRKPTIVLPKSYREMCQTYWNDPGLINTILHELGHILDYGLRWRPAMLDTAVSEYATTNEREAFAEAFMFSARWPGELQLRAPGAAAFFSSLGRDFE